MTVDSGGTSSEALVKSGPLFPDGDLPLMIEPAVQGLDLATWAAANRARIYTSTDYPPRPCPASRSCSRARKAAEMGSLFRLLPHSDPLRRSDAREAPAFHLRPEG